MSEGRLVDSKDSLLNATYSSFSIEPNDLQITFNYFYFLGYGLHKIDETLDKKDATEKLIAKNVPAYDKRNWVDSEAAHYMRNDLLSDLFIDHFHLKLHEIFKQEETIFSVTDSTDSVNKTHWFSISSAYYDKGRNLDSIAPIECSILNNGQVILSIRVMNVENNTDPSHSNIPSYNVIDLIKKPELIRSGSIKEVGALIKKMEDFVKRIELELEKILKLKGLLRNQIGSGKGDCVEVLSILGSSDDEEKSTRSRPYIGVLFRFSRFTYSQIESLFPSIRKFVIAAARTTPVFSTMFIGDEEYLATRDIYMPGRSIVYIARRGWCVFDSEEQDRETFMLGTVESTHTVVTTVFATARSWRKYISTCEKKGKNIFLKLNNSINKFFTATSSFNLKLSRKEFIMQLGIASTFLASVRTVSPEKGISRLIEAHAISHTARSAVRRCEDLTQLRDLEQVSEERIKEYLNFMSVAEDYLQVRTVDYSAKNLIYSRRVLYVAVLTFIATIYMLYKAT